MAEKIYGADHKINKTKTYIYHCQECGFAFYSKRLTSDEEKRFYDGYRSVNYQKLRQKHDVWYTPEINKLIGKNKFELKNRQERVSRFIQDNIQSQIKTALDYGGDKGQIYPPILKETRKYVYEISGVEPVEDVILIDQYEDCKKRSYDFIMCNHVLEHIGNFDLVVEMVKELGNIDTFFYFELPFDSPFYKKFSDNFQFIWNKHFSMRVILKHFSKMKKDRAFAPMTEHINYFTMKSLELLLKKHDFQIVTKEVSIVDCGWQKLKCISILCKIR